LSAIHIDEVRTAINAARALAGLSPATWNRTPLEGTIQLNDILSLRAAYNDLITPLDIPPVAYTNISAGSNVSAEDVAQLRP